jgi:hypothetical protein
MGHVGVTGKALGVNGVWNPMRRDDRNPLGRAWLRRGLVFRLLPPTLDARHRLAVEPPWIVNRGQSALKVISRLPCLTCFSYFPEPQSEPPAVDACRSPRIAWSASGPT